MEDLKLNIYSIGEFKYLINFTKILKNHGRYEIKFFLSEFKSHFKYQYFNPFILNIRLFICCSTLYQEKLFPIQK